MRASYVESVCLALGVDGQLPPRGRGIRGDELLTVLAALHADLYVAVPARSHCADATRQICTEDRQDHSGSILFAAPKRSVCPGRS